MAGTRMRVADILEEWASGAIEKDQIRDFQDIAAEDVRAALRCAAANQPMAIAE